MVDVLEDLRENLGVWSLSQIGVAKAPSPVFMSGLGMVVSSPLARPGSRGPALPAVPPRPGAWDHNYDECDQPKDLNKPLNTIVGAKRTTRLNSARVVSVPPASSKASVARRPRSANIYRVPSVGAYTMGLRQMPMRSNSRCRKKSSCRKAKPDKPSCLGLDELLMRRLFGHAHIGTEDKQAATVDTVIDLLSRRKFFDEKVSMERARDYLENVMRGANDSFLIAKLSNDCSGTMGHLQFAAFLDWVANERGITYSECASKIMTLHDVRGGKPKKKSHSPRSRRTSKSQNVRR